MVYKYIAGGSHSFDKNKIEARFTEHSITGVVTEGDGYIDIDSVAAVKDIDLAMASLGYIRI